MKARTETKRTSETTLMRMDFNLVESLNCETFDLVVWSVYQGLQSQIQDWSGGGGGANPKWSQTRQRKSSQILPWTTFFSWFTDKCMLLQKKSWSEGTWISRAPSCVRFRNPATGISVLLGSHPQLIGNATRIYKFNDGVISCNFAEFSFCKFFFLWSSMMWLGSSNVSVFLVWPLGWKRSCLFDEWHCRRCHHLNAGKRPCLYSALSVGEQFQAVSKSETSNRFINSKYSACYLAAFENCAK